MSRIRFLLWIVLCIILTFAWWTAAPHLFTAGSIHTGLAVNQGVPIAINLGLAWAFGLLNARTPGPATVALVMTSVAMPYALLTILLIAGRAFA